MRSILPVLAILLVAGVVSCGNGAVASSDKADFRLQSLDGKELGPPDFPTRR